MIAIRSYGSLDLFSRGRIRIITITKNEIGIMQIAKITNDYISKKDLPLSILTLYKTTYRVIL